MAGAGEVRPARPRAYGKAVLNVILARVAQGETVQAICRDPGLPTAGTVTRWANERPKFRDRLSRAKTLGGWDHDKKRRAKSYCPVTAQAIFGRLCEGEAMTSICADPAMPGRGVVARWREAVPAFEQAVALARRVQAEGFAELGWEIACGVTPATAYATKVKLEQLRWNAGAMDPTRFGRFKPVPHESAPEAVEDERPIYQYRHFLEETQADGSVRMVAHLRDPETGELVRERPQEAVAGFIAEWGADGCRDG